MKQILSQKTILKQQTSQQTIQLMRMLESNTDTLEKEILKEVENNPVLEIDEGNPSRDCDNYEDKETEYDNRANERFYEKYNYDNDYSDRELDYLINSVNQSKDDEYYTPSAVFESSIQEQLQQKIQEFSLSDEDMKIAEQIVGNLDDAGYLSIPLPDDDGKTVHYANNPIFSIVSTLSSYYNIQTTPEHVEYILTHYIQQLDPPGIGARNLQECLILQMKYGTFNIPEDTKKLILKILEEYFDYISNNHLDKLTKKLAVSKEELQDALSVIKKLSSRPLNALLRSDEAISQITPDFTITIEDEQLFLQLNTSQRLPKIRIIKEYENQYNYYAKSENRQKKEQEVARFIRENVDKANYFINTLTLRETMLYNTMYAIMQHQKAYFLSGDERDLKPMILKTIAEEVGLDPSTISRVSNSKYVQTPFGIIPLKRLFSESVGNDDTSSKEIQSVLKEIIQNEDKSNPLSDKELETALSERGYKIARRTVAKYRENLRILPARQRKRND